MIKLARFNIHFHQEANRHELWRTLEYATGREAGTAVSFAASLLDLRQRVRGLDDPALIQRNALKNIITVSLVGSAISGSASGIELAQNCRVMSAARTKGFSPKASVNFVKEIVATTDILFDERARLTASDTTGVNRTIREKENLLLRRIRQQLLFEFRNWSCHSRAQAWRENTFYSLDAFQNFTRMGASVIGLRGFSDPSLGGGAAITALVANTMATVNPIVAGLAGRSVRNYQFKKLTRELPPDQSVTTKNDTLVELPAIDLQQDLKDLPSDQESKVLDEVISLSNGSRRLDTNLDRESADIERLQRVAQQQTLAGPLIGLTSMPGAILGTLAFYDYRQDRVTTNKMLFAGRISAITGQSYALVQTPFTVVRGILKKNRLKKNGELPSQLLEQRLKNLDNLERQLSEK